MFLRFAQEIVAKTDTTKQSIQTLHDRLREEVRIGATRSVGIFVLPDVISSIARDFPNLKMSLLTQARALTYEGLQQGTLDLAVVLADAVPRGFFAEPLRPEPLCFVISPKHPLASKKIISTEELTTVPFIFGIEGNDFSDMVDEVFEKSGIPRPTGGIIINNLRARKEAARPGAGVTVLPSFTLKDEVEGKTLRILAIKGGRLPDTQLMIIEARRRSSNANVELVKKALEEKLAVGSRHQS